MRSPNPQHLNLQRIFQLIMPIYEYACPDCGHHGEHMQKLADAPIAHCPRCQSTGYAKKISAAGFALKGSGWYVTDFKGGSQATAKAANGGDAQPAATSSDAAATSGTKAEAKAAAPACGAGACPACAD
ncbi:MAG: zinc ribbon domain-containing protein [Chloroflexaceae bacterium]|nr:zinc ribbon domain-containing protein [Chloroflexaceae bacterium]